MKTAPNGVHVFDIAIYCLYCHIQVKVETINSYSYGKNGKDRSKALSRLVVYGKINHDAIQHSWPTRWSVDIVDVQVMSLSLQVVSVFHSLQISKFNVWFQLFDIMPHHNKNVRQIEGSTCQSLPLWLNAHRISHHCRSELCFPTPGSCKMLKG